MAVPCGKCAVCIKNRVDNWKIRLTEESKNSIANSFLTLTYDDEYLPLSGVDKGDLQRFIKRLRHDYSFKYFAISEYGPNTYRAHYHLILFGIDTYSILRNGKKTDVAKKIEEVWRLGNISLENINQNRIKYVAEYHIMKNFNPRKSNPNFCLMSKGIGKNYIEINKKIHQNENTIYYRVKNSKMALPRYYKEKLYEKDILRRSSALNQQKINIKEIQKWNEDPLFEQKRIQNALYFQENYIKQKIKKSKL